MTLRVRRFLLAVLLLGLVLTGCASSDGQANGLAAADGDTPSHVATDSPEDTHAKDDPAETTSARDTDATSIPVPEDDSAADAAIAELDGDTPPEPADADPGATAESFVRVRFNIDPDPLWISCMVAETQRDQVLDTTLRAPLVALGEVDDTQLRSLAFAMNGCIDTLTLAVWATQAIGPQGDVRETAPPCLVKRFDEADGDTIFYNFVALTYQFRLESDGVDGLVDSLATCAPITSLAEFFASQAEQTTNFATLIDRDCLNEILSPAAVSQEFWSVFVGGGSPPIDVVSPYTDECSTTPNSDLALSLPEDFEPWTGSGVLASVQPATRNAVYTAPPPMAIDPAARYEAVIATGGGEIRIELFAGSAPVTVNNFVQLAREGFYDNTTFHRVLDGFMAQAGDPTGTGRGGPGYRFEDEVDGGAALDRKGLLAMANSGPDSNGSQFFITFAETDFLTGLHTLFGEVTQGIEIVDAIELRDPASPTGPGQLVESITIIEIPSD
jgi:cyclophilin family peptidyl-prolyl cis-trans isomerase